MARGMAAFQSVPPHVRAREAAVRDQALLDLISKALTNAFPRHSPVLDPLSLPADARYAAAATVIRPLIPAQRRKNTDLESLSDDPETIQALYAASIGLGPVQVYADDERYKEIKLAGREVLLQESGQDWVPAPVSFERAAILYNMAKSWASRYGVELTAQMPTATIPTRFARVQVMISPMVRPMETGEDQAMIAIRRARPNGCTLDDLVQWGMLLQEGGSFLASSADARLSTIFCGEPGAGKTTSLEAFLSRWYASDHIFTMEESPELTIQGRFTTPLMVDDPEKAVIIARAMLRSTPGVIVPAEARSSEMGAYLSLLPLGVPLCLTIHARTARQGVERAAWCASLNGAYMFERRYEEALRILGESLDLAISVAKWNHLNRRLITEVAFVDGLERDGNGMLQPKLIPVVRAFMTDEGTIAWEQLAIMDEDGMPRWLDGVDRTPERIKEKFRAARIARTQRRASSIDVVAAALQRATLYLQSGDEHAAVMALSTMRPAWATRQAPELLALARQALALDPTQAARVYPEALGALTRVTQAVELGRWREAHQTLQTLSLDLVALASVLDVDDYLALATSIEEGLEGLSTLQRACLDAEAACERGDPHAALDLLNALTSDGSQTRRSLDDERALLLAREKALLALEARGEGLPRALAAIQGQLRSLNQALAS